MPDTAYANFTSIDDGYDQEFASYVTYVTKLVPSVLADSLMFDQAGTNDMMSFPKIGSGMKYFDCLVDGTKTSFPCTDVLHNGIAMSHHPTKLTLTDPDGWQKALSDAGLLSDWVVFGEYQRNQPNMNRVNPVPEYKFHQFPLAAGKPVVPNPKDIILKGMENIPALWQGMQATWIDIMLGQWVGGSPEDAVQAYSMPVFMLMQAVDGMARAKQLGAKEEETEKKAEEDKKKNLILLILSIVFMFVPIIGEEVAAAAGLATLARTVAIAGELGNAALGIYDTVQDPSSAFVNILGTLFGVGAIARSSRDGTSISKIAQLRKGMSGDATASFGKIFQDNDGKLQKLMVSACKAV